MPILALRRPGWEPVAGDRWTLVDDAAEAVAALGARPRRVFLALGRQEVAAFEAAPAARLCHPQRRPGRAAARRARCDLHSCRAGRSREADERALLAEHRIDAIVSKNSGGEATYGKIAAARELGIEVIMFRRPELPDVPAARDR